MKTRTKIALGAGALVLVYLAVRRSTKPTLATQAKAQMSAANASQLAYVPA